MVSEQRASKPNSLAMLGGTFDPIHIGHLRSALEVQQALGVDELRLVPCHSPPHRGQPRCTSQQRLQMAELAVRDESNLRVDGRELRRSGPSYSVDTLAELRQELGATAPLYLVVGTDAFASLDQWHQWPRLFELAHVVVMTRPGWQLPNSEPLKSLIAQKRVDICHGSHGQLQFLQQIQLPISATQVRDMIAAGQSPRYLLTDAVWDYIQRHSLYGCSAQQPSQHPVNTHSAVTTSA